MKRLLQKFVLPLFIFTVIANLTAIAGYDFLYFDKIAQYKFPPLASFFYNTETKQFEFFNFSYLPEALIVIGLTILFTIPASISPLKVFFPAIFIIFCFWAFDTEIQAHLRIPTIRTLSLLFTFKDFLGYKAIIGGIIILAILLFALYSVLRGFYVSLLGILKGGSRMIKIQFALIFALKVVSIVMIILSFTVLLPKYYKSVWWYEKEEVWSNGRFVAFYHNSLREIRAYRELQNFQYNLSLPPHRILFPDTLKNKPNIYVILLESHIDLSRLKNYKFSRFPIHPYLLKFMPDSLFSLIVSPVYGGYTAQATFEILTGTPALHQLSPVEFLVFGSHTTSSILTRLKEQGYHTFAFIANSDIFFNMPTAYKDMGFDSSVFLGSISPYKEYFTDRNWIIPDEELYSYFLKHYNTLPEPRFIYFVTMYGHWPWFTPLDSDTISVYPRVEPLPALANVIYRKQRILAQFIDTLLKLDSSALIIAFTDHNPPFILTDSTKFKYDAPSIYHVPILILYKGKKVNIPTVAMHRVPELLYYLLAHDSLPADTTSLVPLETKRYLYKQIIKQSREGS